MRDSRRHYRRRDSALPQPDSHHTQLHSPLQHQRTARHHNRHRGAISRQPATVYHLRIHHPPLLSAAIPYRHHFRRCGRHRSRPQAERCHDTGRGASHNAGPRPATGKKPRLLTSDGLHAEKKLFPRGGKKRVCGGKILKEGIFTCHYFASSNWFFTNS